MNDKEEYIKKYGEAAYGALEKMRSATREWQKEHPGEVREASHEGSRRGGKYYKRALRYNHMGLQGERNKIRYKHAREWQYYKETIDPLNLTQLHRLWTPGTVEYTGLALVERDQHRRGVIDIIEVLEGTISVFTEREVKGRGITHPYELFDVISNGKITMRSEDELRAQECEL